MSTASPAVPTRRRRGKRRDAWSIGGWIFLALLLIFSFVPMLWMFLTSIKTQFAALEYPPQWIPEAPTLDNYRRLLSPSEDFGQDFLRWLGADVRAAVVDLSPSEALRLMQGETLRPTGLPAGFVALRLGEWVIGRGWVRGDLLRHEIPKAQALALLRVLETGIGSLRAG